ncbi:TolC family protein [Pedobacter sp. Du54]|uniref:TolC family protein n=1 Tax=Pedobacter anseongensis TaxID=3133439 RepID=UPI0030A7B81B
MKQIITLIVLALIGVSLSTHAQQKLSLDDCYQLAMQNYPLAKQRNLIETTSAYTLSNLEKGYLPQITLSAQASYQSDVTQLPIRLPNVTVPTPSKDQYKVAGEISQSIYDGGLIKQQRELQKTNAILEQQKLDLSLYQLKEKINQLFFGSLLIEAQIKQNGLLINDIELGLKKVEAAIDNGTALKSNGDVLKADLLKNKQRIIELQAAQTAYIQMLGLFIGKDMTNETLAKPQPIVVQNEVKRPELLIYATQHKNLDVQDALLISKSLPRFSIFFQGGYGKPALNFLSNSFDLYYISGIRLAWSPSTFYTLKKDRALININRKTIEVQRETFLFNTNLTISQQNVEINKFQTLLNSDSEIIALRAKVKRTAIAQLENGVINSNDYLREANAENQARENKIIHEIQLLLAQYNQQTTIGN